MPNLNCRTVKGRVSAMCRVVGHAWLVMAHARKIQNTTNTKHQNTVWWISKKIIWNRETKNVIWRNTKYDMEKYQQIHGLDSVPSRCRVVGHKRPVRAQAPTIQNTISTKFEKEKRWWISKYKIWNKEIQNMNQRNTKYEREKYKIWLGEIPKNQGSVASQVQGCRAQRAGEGEAWVAATAQLHRPVIIVIIFSTSSTVDLLQTFKEWFIFH